MRFNSIGYNLRNELKKNWFVLLIFDVFLYLVGRIEKPIGDILVHNSIILIQIRLSNLINFDNVLILNRHNFIYSLMIVIYFGKRNDNFYCAVVSDGLGAIEWISCLLLNLDLVFRDTF